MWLILFFLSGVTGLLYEIVWIRVLSLVLGASVYSISVVFAAFMLGLGLGNVAAVRILERARNAARAYAIVEAGIGAGALLVPLLLRLVTPMYQALHDAHLPTLIAVRFALSFLIVLLPTVMIGTTFPIMVRIFSSKSVPVGATIGTLYAVNTFGAVTGTLLTSFVLLKYVGLSGALIAGAGTNAAIAIVAYASSRRVAGVVPRGGADSWESGPPNQLVAAAFFLSGFTALAYEVVWTRILTIYISGSVLGLAYAWRKDVLRWR